MEHADSHEHGHLQNTPKRPGRPRRQQPQPYMNTGSDVEVNREEGLEGAWYPATVSSTPSSSSKRRNPYTGKVCVEYKSLINDKDSSKPLREYVNAQFVRPVSPVENQARLFNICDIVDAYYSDGWWTGVITEIFDGDRFRVTFQNSPDARDFGLSDLRLHRQWVNGSWTTPAKQCAAGPMFSVGKMAEVSFDTRGFEDIWFPATIVEDKGNGIFRVDYNKRNRDGGRLSVRENVDSLHIRPCPPLLKEVTFCLLDKVDAFYDFGWWSGVITKELAESRYNIFFKHTKTEREFGFSELRPHMECKDGKWLSSSKEVSIPSDYEMNYDTDKNGSRVGVTVPLNNPMPIKRKFDENMPFSPPSSMNNNKHVAPTSNDESQVINSSPSKMTMDSPCKETLNGEAHAVASPAEKNASNYNARNVENAEENVKPIGVDQLKGSHSLQKKAKRKRGMDAEKEETAVVRSGKTRVKKVQVKTSQNTIVGKEGNEAGKEGNEADGVTEDVPRVCPIVDISLPVVLGLACDSTKRSALKQSSRIKGREAVKKCIGVETLLNGVKFEASNGTQKRGRGRPRRNVEPLAITPMLAVDVVTKLEPSILGQALGTKGSCEMLVGDQNMQENESGNKIATSPLLKGGENDAEASVKLRYVRKPTKRGKKRMMDLRLITNVHDVASPNSGEGKIVESSCMTEETERVVPESPSNTFENQPLSKWFGDLNFPAVDSSRSDMEIITKETTTTPSVDEIIPSELPFEKKSPIWSVLESMEVFQKLPQNPHFEPLDKFKLNLREGLAIGLMVTFTGVVEKTSKLKYDDLKASIDEASIEDVMETVMELETHGFQMGVVHKRIGNLRRIKERQKKLEQEVRKLESETEEKEKEKSRIDEEMEEMKKQIKELEEKVLKATSLKEIKDGEMKALKSKLMSVKEDIKNISCEFEGNGCVFMDMS